MLRSESRSRQGPQMSATPDSTLADPQQVIAELQRQLDERTAERDEALARETATAEVLQVINASPDDLKPVFDAILEKARLPRATVDWDTSQADDFRREVGHGRSNEPSWSGAGRGAATAKVWRGGARARGQDVTPAQDRGSASAIARGRPGDRLARAGRHGSDADRLA